jgi:hypothetical protein
MVNQKFVMFRPITIPLSATVHLEAVLKMRQDIVGKSYPFHRKVTSLISVVMARFLDNTAVFQISSLFLSTDMVWNVLHFSILIADFYLPRECSLLLFFGTFWLQRVRKVFFKRRLLNNLLTVGKLKMQNRGI